MTDAETSVLEVTVGDGETDTPKVQVSVNLTVGDESVSEGSALLQSEISQSPEPFVIYLLIDTESPERAGTLSELLKTVLEAPPGTGTLAFVLGFLRQSFDPVISSQGNNTVLALHPHAQKKGQTQSYFDRIAQQSQGLLMHKNAVSISVDIRDSFESILNSGNVLLAIGKAVRARLELTLWKRIGSALTQLATAMGASPSSIAALEMVGFYRNADLRVRFNSLEELPTLVRRLLPSPELVQSKRETLNALLTEEEKQLIRQVTLNASGKVGFRALGKHGFVTATANVPGFSLLFE